MIRTLFPFLLFSTLLFILLATLFSSPSTVVSAAPRGVSVDGSDDLEAEIMREMLKSTGRKFSGDEEEEGGKEKKPVPVNTWCVLLCVCV